MGVGTIEVKFKNILFVSAIISVCITILSDMLLWYVYVLEPFQYLILTLMIFPLCFFYVIVVYSLLRAGSVGRGDFYDKE